MNESGKSGRFCGTECCQKTTNRANCPQLGERLQFHTGTRLQSGVSGSKFSHPSFDSHPGDIRDDSTFSRADRYGRSADHSEVCSSRSPAELQSAAVDAEAILRRLIARLAEKAEAVDESLRSRSTCPLGTLHEQHGLQRLRLFNAGIKTRIVESDPPRITELRFGPRSGGRSSERFDDQQTSDFAADNLSENGGSDRLRNSPGRSGSRPRLHRDAVSMEDQNNVPASTEVDYVGRTRAALQRMRKSILAKGIRNGDRPSKTVASDPVDTLEFRHPDRRPFLRPEVGASGLRSTPVVIRVGEDNEIAGNAADAFADQSSAVDPQCLASDLRGRQHLRDLGENDRLASRLLHDMEPRHSLGRSLRPESRTCRDAGAVATVAGCDAECYVPSLPENGCESTELLQRQSWCLGCGTQHPRGYCSALRPTGRTYHHRRSQARARAAAGLLPEVFSEYLNPPSLPVLSPCTGQRQRRPQAGRSDGETHVIPACISFEMNRKGLR